MNVKSVQELAAFIRSVGELNSQHLKDAGHGLNVDSTGYLAPICAHSLPPKAQQRRSIVISRVSELRKEWSALQRVGIVCVFSAICSCLPRGSGKGRGMTEAGLHHRLKTDHHRRMYY